MHFILYSQITIDIACRKSYSPQISPATKPQYTPQGSCDRGSPPFSPKKCYNTPPHSTQREQELPHSSKRSYSSMTSQEPPSDMPVSLSQKIRNPSPHSNQGSCEHSSAQLYGTSRSPSPTPRMQDFLVATPNDMKNVIVEMSQVLTTVVTRLDKIEKGQSTTSKSPSSTSSTPQRPKAKVPLVVRVCVKSFLSCCH